MIRWWEKRKLNLASSPELAYILGCYLGDLSVCKIEGRHYVTTTRVKDETFRDAISKALDKIGFHTINDINRHYFRVRAYSKPFYIFIKALTLRDIERLIEGYEAHFLRGFYDSEGNFSKKVSYPFIRMVNSNQEFLFLIKRALRKLGIYFTEYINDSRQSNQKISYGIQIARRAQVSKFLKMVGTSIQRKGW